MGAVYEVEHLHTGQHLALKILTAHPGASVERFKREARAASHIKSDHIVRVTDADVAPELGGASFMVMDLLEGADLERTTGDAPAPLTDVVEWLRQTSRGLAKAHDAGIVHRDLKPENLFLTQREDGSPLVKILDFGIAKLLSADASALTGSDTLLGTPSYMAPEQTDSSGPPITLQADLYAMGLIAFKLLMGRTYWRSGSLAQLMAQILAEPMPPASQRGSTFGPAFDAWFERACHRNPAKRFASAVEQVEALAAALGVPSEAPRASTPNPQPMPTATADAVASPSLNASSTDLVTGRRRKARRLGGGVAAAIAAAGVVVAVVHGGQQAETRSAAEPPSAAKSVLTPDALPPSAAVVPGTAANVAVLAPPSPAADAGAASSAAAAPVAGKPRSTAPAASGRPAASAEGAKGRDPLEGPW
jgi:serine/threonine protein kinase